MAEPLRASIPITTDIPPKLVLESETSEPPQAKKRKVEHGIGALDLSYETCKAHVEKGKEVVDFEREGACTLCKDDLEHNAGIYAICPSPGCESVTHLTCLGKHFVEDADSVLPIKGNCPSCKTELRWADIVKEATLRLRGQKEVEKLLKVKRARKGATASQAASEELDHELSEEEFMRDVQEELEFLRKFDPTGDNYDGIWHEIDDSDDSDTRSTTSTDLRKGKAKPAAPTVSKAGTLRTVVEDSDWDDAVDVD